MGHKVDLTFLSPLKHKEEITPIPQIQEAVQRDPLLF